MSEKSLLCVIHHQVYSRNTLDAYRYFLAGENKGEMEVFADNLPGLPDNIRRSGRGTYWVGLASVRHAGKFSVNDFAAPRPWLRSLAAKVSLIWFER
jgi:sugar lactone lactonase YvrE